MPPKKQAALEATRALLSGGKATNDTKTPPLDASTSGAQSIASETKIELTVEAKAKKVKSLNKKLKQIEELKAKVKKEGNSALNEDQTAKLESEASIRAEIAKLQ